MRKKAINFFGSVGLIILLMVSTGTAVYSQKSENQVPEPKVIQPGKKGKAPSDAIVLFDKGSLNNFESIKDGEPAGWQVRGKKFTVNPKTTSIQTKEKFGDCQLHIEWNSPVKDVKAGKKDQGCGNSGVYLMGKYEVQVLNSYINKTYPKGQAGAIYEQYAPLVDTIVASQTKDVNYISYTLDFMLDFCFDHQMLQLYRKLCRYLYDIDIETTASYVNAYREMWDEKGEMFGNFNEMLPKW